MAKPKKKSEAPQPRQEPPGSRTSFTALPDYVMEDARAYSDALADVLCWFLGFKAANPDTTLIPGLDRLRSLKKDLHDHIEKLERK